MDRIDFLEFEKDEWYPNTWAAMKEIYEDGINSVSKILFVDKNIEKVAIAYLEDVINNHDEGILYVRKFCKELCEFAQNKSKNKTSNENLFNAILSAIADKEFYELVNAMFDAIDDELSPESQDEKENIKNFRLSGFDYHTGVPLRGEF